MVKPMEITPKSAKNSLKFKAGIKNNIVSVKIGARKFVVPAETRVLSNEKYAFVSFPAVRELYKIVGKDLVPVNANSDAHEAHKQLYKPAAKKKARTRKSVEMSADLESVLKKLPSGTKPVHAPKGGYRLVKTRKRG